MGSSLENGRSDVNEFNDYLLAFSNQTRPKVVDLLASEIRKLKGVKAGFELRVTFVLEKIDDPNTYMDHYFHDQEPRILIKDADGGEN